MLRLCFVPRNRTACRRLVAIVSALRLRARGRMRLRKGPRMIPESGPK